MLRSLKAKFILAFGTLVVVLFVALGGFLVNAKTQELSNDIATGTEAYAEFTVERIMELYQTELAPGNFLPFTREISALLRTTPEVPSLQILTYNGVEVYDSSEEKTERYSGTLRTADAQTLERVQSTKMSLLLEDGRVLYIKVDEQKNKSYVNFNEESVTPLTTADRIKNIVMPYENSYAVIYEVSYATLEERLAMAKLQIGVVAGVGVLLTLMISFMLAVSITRPLNELKEGALKIAAGNFSARVQVKTKDEVGILAGTFNQMAADLAASMEVRLYKERVAHELELAAKMQIDLLPKEKLALPTLEIAGGLHPATEVGGDAFDFITMENGNTLVYLGDGTGHGVPAGIMASISNALLYAFRGENDLKVMAKHMNEVIQKKSSNTMFITMALTLWNEASSTLKYLNAGHLPLLYFDAATKKLTEIKLPGMAFGMVDDIVPHLQEHDIVLKPNDVVVLYSDGIPDAQNDRKETYGVQRLKRIVQDTANDLYAADAIKTAILADVMQFIGSHEHLDDITVVVMKKK